MSRVVLAASPASAGPSSSAGASTASSSAAIEAQVLAFGGANKIAERVASDICKVLPSKSTLIIYDQGSFGSLQAFEGFVANIHVLVASYKSLIPPDRMSGLVGYVYQLTRERQQANSAAAARDWLTPELKQHLNNKLNEFSIGIQGDPLADLTSLASAIAISSNTETPGSVVVPDSAIALALTDQLTGCNKQPTIVYPPLFGKTSSSDFATADIETDIQVLQDVRQYAHEIVHDENMQFLRDHPKIPSGDSIRLGALTDINGLYDSFINSLLQINAATGVSGSASVIQGYRLALLLKVPATRVLLASVVGAGGTEHVHKTFWTALSTGDHITYSGGLVVDVSLWKGIGGNPILSRIVEYKTAFKDADGAVAVH
jgi:hypothetical protein